MTAIVKQSFPRKWGGQTTEAGHREYTVLHVVEAAATDGPRNVMHAAGLPLPGAIWSYNNDLDFWAFCTPYIKVTPQGREGDPTRIWHAEQKYSTRPTERCRDQTIDDPLMEPQKLSGSFVTYTREMHTDKNGAPIRTTSHELIRGSQVEFDDNKATVTVEQNVLSLGLAGLTSIIGRVNDAPLWGLPARYVKFSNMSWSRNVQGTCDFYYTRTLQFDIDFRSFDRTVLNESSLMINGHWNGATGNFVTDNIAGAPPDPLQPGHYRDFQTLSGARIRGILNTNGTPWNGSGAAPTVTVQYYKEANLLSLGIPDTL